LPVEGYPPRQYRRLSHNPLSGRGVKLIGRWRFDVSHKRHIEPPLAVEVKMGRASDFNPDAG
jgi:hypothetical protein